MQTTAIKVREPAIPSVQARAVRQAAPVPSPAVRLLRMAGNGTFSRMLDGVEVSQPGDPWERDAERTAQSVLSQPAGTVAAAGSPAPPASPNGALPGLGAGEPLAQAARSFFEPRFGADFGGVRVHSGATAAQLAQSAGAVAFTFGRDIVFDHGQYQPESPQGHPLLAHELAHTLQTGAAQRIARACALNLAAVSIPSEDSALTANAFIDMASVPITSSISVAPLAANFNVVIDVPRALQQSFAGTGFLGNLRTRINISGSIQTPGGAAIAAQFPNNELCIYVTFHQGENAQEWFADLRILAGGHMEAPIQLGLGTPAAAPPSNAPAGLARVTLDLANDVTASAGPLRLTSLNDITANWNAIRDQIRDSLALSISNIEIPLSLGARASVTVPVPVGGEAGSIIPVEVLGGIHLDTRVSTAAEGYQLRLSGEGRGSTGAGLVSLELSGRGRLSGPLPQSIRLGDISDNLLQRLIADSRGSGEVTGRLTVAGLPGRIHSDFTIRDGSLFGNADFISPFGIAGGQYRYKFGEGLSARLGMLGLVNLTLDPAQSRFEEQLRSHLGPAPWDLGGSVTGLGVTGVNLTPSNTQILSAGVGPQFIRNPAGEKSTGFFGGIQYQLSW